MPMFYHLLMPSELVYPSKSHLVGTARQIASESFLMLLHVGTKGRISLKYNEVTIWLDAALRAPGPVRAYVISFPSGCQ